MTNMEVEPPKETANPSDERLKGWTKNDIFDLLQCIKVFGSRDIEQIAENIPTKTPEAIIKAIEYYREKASQRDHPPIKKSNIFTTKNKSNQPPIPLISWAKFLQNSLNYKELHTETPTSLRLIAEFDNIPAAKVTNNIDFKNIYHSIANAMDGKNIPSDTAMAAILNKCIVETALTSKAFMRVGALQSIVETIDMSDKALSVVPRPTEVVELATLRHLASQRAYNPLNIAEQYLKPS